jgi:hypothetical protein
MALTVLLSTPQNNDISIPIDSEMELIFSKPIDKFTVLNGISIYSIGAQSWTGSLLSTKDSLTSDVRSSAGEINIIEFSASVSGANVTIVPSVALNPNTQYYLQVVPGDDTTRFVSAQTTDDPIYSIAATGTVNILSAYSGIITGVYTLVFTSPTEFDVLFDGIFSNSYTFTPANQITIEDNLTLSVSSGFKANDTATINVYAPEGLDSICKITFTTSQYTSSAPTSIKIEDKLYANAINELKVINTIPPALSVNNSNVNPITIKFNRAIDSTQDLTDKVKIHKVNIETGDIKRIRYVAEINGSIVKLYMQSVEQIAEISESHIYGLDINKLSKIESYNYIV